MKQTNGLERLALQLAEREVAAAQVRTWDILQSGVALERHTDARTSLDCLLSLARVGNMLRNASEITEGLGKPIYLVDSWFLDECRKYLTRSEKEEMLFVTGSEFGKIRTLSRFQRLEYSEQSRVFVQVDDASTRSVLKELEARGHHVLAWFHSHPGTGIESTSPSNIDLEHQSDLELGGYPTIGAIFTADGWVRFFSQNTSFEIRVFGNGVSQIDPMVIRLAGGSAR